MILDDVLRAGALVQAVDVLRDDHQLARRPRFERSERAMRLGGLAVHDGRAHRPEHVGRLAALRAERVDVRELLERWVAPQPAGPAIRRKPRRARDAGTGEHDDVAVSHRLSVMRTITMSSP